MRWKGLVYVCRGTCSRTHTRTGTHLEADDSPAEAEPIILVETTRCCTQSLPRCAKLAARGSSEGARKASATERSTARQQQRIANDDPPVIILFPTVSPNDQNEWLLDESSIWYEAIRCRTAAWSFLALRVPVDRASHKKSTITVGILGCCPMLR